MGFERIGGEEVWAGRIASVRVDRFRYDDGEEAEREIVAHPGAVAIVPCVETHVWLIRQPREICGEEALLEIPAGKLDKPGEDLRAAAERELAEEIGKAAGSWALLTRFYTSPGFAAEEVHVYVATELKDAQPSDAEEDERLELVEVPLAHLDDVIAECRDAKSLVGLLWFRAFHR